VPHAEYPDLAQVAYEAYARSTGGKTFDGREMPQFDDLGDAIQAAWQAAAQNIVNTVREYEARETMMLTNPPQQPSVGGIVLVPMDPRQNNGADTAAAVITRVWNDTTINVRVLPDGDFPTKVRTSVTYADDIDPAQDPANSYHRWTWPPRV
jgi:hypothetical protein